MIHEVSGDILLSKAQAIAHGVAPDDDFAQGLALALRENWPAMYKDFRHFCHTHHPKPGGAWSWGGPGVRVINLLTQEAPDHHRGHPGRAKLTHVRHALQELRQIIVDESLRSVALPRVATGVGGLDWDEVRPLIDQYLGDVEAEVYVYADFKPGVKAAEA